MAAIKLEYLHKGVIKSFEINDANVENDFEDYPQDKQVLRAIIELQLKPEVASKRVVYRHIVTNHYYEAWGEGAESSTVVARAFSRLASLGLIYKSGQHWWCTLIQQ
jgi:hypothetical protein